MTQGVLLTKAITASHLKMQVLVLVAEEIKVAYRVPSKERNLHNRPGIHGPRSDSSRKFKNIVCSSKVCRPTAKEGVGFL